MTYRRFLLAAFVAVWTWAAIKPASSNRGKHELPE